MSEKNNKKRKIHNIINNNLDNSHVVRSRTYNTYNTLDTSNNLQPMKPKSKYSKMEYNKKDLRINPIDTLIIIDWDDT
jgi:hypothetical protein